MSDRHRIDPARARYLAIRIHALGPRSLFHLFLDLDAEADLAETLEHFASLPVAFVDRYGWRELDPPAKLVGGGK
jgi:hypothetical protein